MTKEQLFESMQFLDDALLEEAPVRRAAPQRHRLRWAAAACLVLAVGALALLTRPEPARRVPPAPDISLPEPVSGAGETGPRPIQSVGVPGPGAGTGETGPRPIQPGGVPGPGAETAAPPPAELTWNELDAPEGALSADVAGVIQVAEPLTEAQITACAPSIRLEWMDDFSGFASYYLWDGSGGLARIEMKVTHPGTGEYTVRLRDAGAPEMPECIVRPRPETDAVGSLNGLEYRAYRLRYLHGEGDPALYPPEAWTEMAVVFVRENVEYTLLAAVPETLAEAAGRDLTDLLLAYAGSHSVPDLSAFRCGEYLYRDDSLTLTEALSDPDFGAYLPAEGPEGFAFDSARRYQFEEVANYLMACWTRGRAELQWLVRQLPAEAEGRIVTPEERERYDLTLYSVPWSASVPQALRASVEDPVFRVGELTPEILIARVQPGDDGMTMCRFGVLYDSGILVEVSARGVPPEWVCETLKQPE